MARSPVESLDSSEATPYPSAPSRWPSTFDVLRLRNYRIIWFGTILAFMAFNMSSPAQGVVAYDLTGSNRAVGFVQFGQGIAMVLLNPITGALVDRLPKRHLILIAQSVIGLTMLTIGILVLTDSIQIVFLAMGSFVIGCMFAFNGPTRTSLIRDIVDEERIGSAMAMVQVGGNFSRIAGPFIAGALLSWPLVGSGGTYLVVASIMVFVTITLFQLPAPAPKPKQPRGLLEDVRAGLAYVRTTPAIFHTLASFHAMAILGFSYYVLMPGLSKDVLGVGTAGLGVLLGATAAGGLVFSLIVAPLADSHRVPVILTGSSLLLGLGLIGLGFAPSFGFAIVAMLIIGGGSSSFQTLNNVMAARLSHEDYLGRVISLMFMGWGFNGLASLPIGALADMLGEQTVLIGMGCLVCVLTGILALWYRRFATQHVTV